MAVQESPARRTIAQSIECPCCLGKPAVDLRGGTVTDPVCGMAVSPRDTTPNTVHAGDIFYFCAPACRRAFERDPAAYLPPD